MGTFKYLCRFEELKNHVSGNYRNTTEDGGNPLFHGDVNEYTACKKTIKKATSE